jgi:hypothetical protein
MEYENQQQRREQIIAKFLEDVDRSPLLISQELGYKYSTVWEVIDTYKRTGTIARREGGGRNPDPLINQAILDSLVTHPNLSQRARAALVGTSRGTVQRVMAGANNL